MNRASYKHAVAWIAGNDGMADTAGLPEPDAVAMLKGQLTVGLVADIFDRDPEKVARAVLKQRREVSTSVGVANA